MKQKPKPRKITLVDSSYEPTKAELEEEFQIDATFEELTRAVAESVEIEYVKKPKRKASSN